MDHLGATLAGLGEKGMGYAATIFRCKGGNAIRRPTATWAAFYLPPPVQRWFVRAHCDLTSTPRNRYCPILLIRDLGQMRCSLTQLPSAGGLDEARQTTLPYAYAADFVLLGSVECALSYFLSSQSVMAGKYVTALPQLHRS